MPDEMVKLMIDEEEKEFSLAALTQGIKTQGELTEQVTAMQDSFNGVTLAAKQYGTDTKTYLESAESAFGVLNTLIEAGLIDEAGAIVKPTGDSSSKEGGKSDTNKNKASSFSFETKEGENNKGENDLLSAVENLIDKKLGTFNEKFQQIESSQSTLFKAGLSARIKAKHPEFTDTDVETVMNNAFADRTQDLWAHAESVKNSNTTHLQEQEKIFAAKYGVDLEQVKKHEELKEQHATGGIGALFKGKRFSFRKKTRNDTEFIRPSEAVKTFNASQG